MDSGYTTGLFGGTFNNCYFYGESPFDGVDKYNNNARGLLLGNLTCSVLDIIIPEGMVVYVPISGNKKSVINNDKLFGGYDAYHLEAYISGKPIEVTTKQLSDAVYLQSQKFDIAVDDSEIETHTWYIDDYRMITNKYLPDLIDVGAFANATNLTYVRIPPTVKKIGRYSFRNTKLTSVTIASDCEYYDTSFPDGCQIKFY